jgi:predicted RNase H-like nuclease (RuvC/YqgF family)
MPEEKRKINCWIPISLYDRIESAGYESVTQAVIEGLQRILKDTEGYNQDTIGSSQDAEGYLKDIETLNIENKQLKEKLARHEKDISGYKKDLERIQEGYNQDITEYKENIKVLNVEIVRLKDFLSNAPDPAELADIKARFEERQTLLEEKDKRIMELTEHKENMSVFANYFKSKTPELIGAPAAEKKKPWYKFW